MTQASTFSGFPVLTNFSVRAAPVLMIKNLGPEENGIYVSPRYVMDEDLSISPSFITLLYSEETRNKNKKNGITP